VNVQDIETKLTAYGIDYAAVFVPQSVSRNSQEKNPCLNWRVSIARASKPRTDGGLGRAPGASIATDYMQGIGHVPKDPRARFNPYSVAQDNYERECAESGRYAGGKLPAPKLADVLYSLLLDGEAADETFEDWCANYGYDSDSRKAEATFSRTTKEQ
jgi:hypothetical protein